LIFSWVLGESTWELGFLENLKLDGALVAVVGIDGERGEVALIS
jgi:hypothetical protein